MEKFGTVGVLAYVVVYVNKSLGELKEAIARMTGVIEKCGGPKSVE